MEDGLHYSTDAPLRAPRRQGNVIGSLELPFAMSVLFWGEISLAFHV